MQVTADGEILESVASRGRSRSVRIGDEIVTVPRRPAEQRRRLVWPTVERIYRSLCKKHGASFATDFAILAMVWQDAQHVFGDRSIARARRRAAKLGLITSKQVLPNRKAGDRKTYCGTVKVRFPDVTKERRGAWRDKVDARKRREAEKREANAERARETRKREREVQRKLEREVAAAREAESLVRAPQSILEAIDGKEIGRPKLPSEDGEIKLGRAPLDASKKLELEHAQEPLAGEKASVPAIERRRHKSPEEQRRELAELEAQWELEDRARELEPPDDDEA